MTKKKASRKPATGRRVLVALGFIAVFGSFFALTNYYLDMGRMSADEGFYAIASRNVMQGELPYRDFAYTQMPLLPYLNGAAMTVLGWEMDTQRAINIFWALIGVGAVLYTLRRRFGSWEPGLLAAFTVAASPYWCEFQAMGKTYGAAGMFLALATCVMLLRMPIYRKTVLVALLGTLATGCRLSLAPVIAFYVLALITEATGKRERLLVPAIAAGIGGGMLLPFFIAAPGNMLFFVYEYHTASIFMRRGLKLLVEWWQMAPAAIILLGAGFACTGILRKKGLKSEVLLMLGLLAGLILPMLSASAYGNYIIPVLLSAATAGTAALWSAGKTPLFSLRQVIWLLPLLALFHPLPRTFDGLENNNDKISSIASYVDSAFRFRPHAEEAKTSSAVRSVAAFLKENAPKGPILTPVLIVATEADREIMPGTDMGMFTVMGSEDYERAEKLHLVTLDGLVGMVDRREPAAIVLRTANSLWNFKWCMPSLRRHPSKEYARLQQALSANYKPAHQARDLLVYLRK
jgi:hypothetical protein